ncbi:hypothetical protein [Streptomyces sp. NPDC018947]|uniref:hypothetical protein n=1 Tax=Streptomyces sp. NPDC018947 TaxID=3365054 RepID=UPI00378D6E5E
MTTRGRALRYTAISALVVLSLTGFSTGRGHGGGGDGGGGGCSSSSQDHDSSSSTSGGVSKDDDYDDYGTSGGSGYGSGDYDSDHDDEYGDTGGNGGSALRPATVELVSCASPEDPYATVEITNPNGVEHTFAVTVFFKDGSDVNIDDASQEATVPAGGVSRVRLPLDAPGMVPDHCELDDQEPLPLT